MERICKNGGGIITIEFEKRKYTIREVEIPGVGERIIASTELNNILISEDGEYKSDEARYIDEQIYFFLEPDKLNFSDTALSLYVNGACN